MFHWNENDPTDKDKHGVDNLCWWIACCCLSLFQRNLTQNRLFTFLWLFLLVVFIPLYFCYSPLFSKRKSHKNMIVAKGRVEKNRNIRKKWSKNSLKLMMRESLAFLSIDLYALRRIFKDDEKFRKCSIGICIQFPYNLRVEGL